MSHRLLEFYDTFVIGIVTICASIAAKVLAVESATGQVDELRILMVPLVSSLISTGGLYLFNLGKEPRNIVMGRAVFALMFGASTLPVLSIFFPSWSPILERPVILLIGGGMASVLFYLLSYPITRALFNRSDGIAENLLDQAERRSHLNIDRDKDKP